MLADFISTLTLVRYYRVSDETGTESSNAVRKMSATALGWNCSRTNCLPHSAILNLRSGLSSKRTIARRKSLARTCAPETRLVSDQRRGSPQADAAAHFPTA